ALPPLSSLVPLLAAAEAACDDGDNGEFEELALRLAGAIAAALAGTRRLAHRPSQREERRVTDARSEERRVGHACRSTVETEHEGIRDWSGTGVQPCALPICAAAVVLARAVARRRGGRVRRRRQRRVRRTGPAPCGCDCRGACRHAPPRAPAKPARGAARHRC